MTKLHAPVPADRSDNDRRPRRGRMLIRTAGLVSLGAVAVLTLAACNNSDTGSGTTQPTGAAAITEGSAAQNGGQGAGQNGQGAGGQRRPGASGLIAEVDSNSMQVQASDSQTTVNWTSKTTFAQTVKGSLTDVTVGSCVVAIAPRTDTGSPGSAGGTAAPSTLAAPTQTDEPVTAGTVAITAAVDGECTIGFGGGFGGGGRTMPTGQQMPSGSMPTGDSGAPPSGQPGAGGRSGGTGQGGSGGQGAFPGGGAGFGGIVTGKVTAVTGSTISVESTRFGAPGGAAGTSGTTSSGTTAGEKTTRTVQVTSSTTYTTEKKAASSAVKTGLCATAVGTADDTGAIAATSVSLSDAVDGQCTSGRGFTGGRGGQRNGQGQTTTGTTANG